MKAFKKIILIIVCSFILIKISGYFLDKGFKNYYTPFFEKMDFVFKDTSYNDIIYLGNSRANFGINPYFVDSICKIKSYNLGFGGTDIAGGIAFLQSYLIHHAAPKYLVYTYDYRIFQLRSRLELAPVYFYYAQYKPVRNELQRFGYHETFLRYLPDLKYCFFNDYYRTCVIKGLNGESMSSPVKQQAMEKYLYDYRGFINYQLRGLNVTEKEDTSLPGLHTECINMLSELVNICNQNKIKLIFIYPPEFYDHSDSKEITERKMIIDSMMISTCKKNNFYYNRFDTKDFLPQDFIDGDHVNIKGSIKYSVMMGNYLKTIMQ